MWYLAMPAPSTTSNPVQPCLDQVPHPIRSMPGTSTASNHQKTALKHRIQSYEMDRISYDWMRCLSQLQPSSTASDRRNWTSPPHPIRSIGCGACSTHGLDRIARVSSLPSAASDSDATFPNWRVSPLPWFPLQLSLPRSGGPLVLAKNKLP